MTFLHAVSSALDVWNGDARGITCGETRDIARDLDVCEGKREREIGKLKCRLLKNWRSQNNLRWFWPVATERAFFCCFCLSPGVLSMQEIYGTATSTCFVARIFLRRLSAAVLTFPRRLCSLVAIGTFASRCGDGGADNARKLNEKAGDALSGALDTIGRVVHLFSLSRCFSKCRNLSSTVLQATSFLFAN